MASIDKELPALFKEEQHLLKARVTLNTLRNRSSTLAPINTLPLEILSHIFTLTNFSCVQDDRNYAPSFRPTVFLSVCTYWRQTAIATSRFWSHIDLVPSSDPLHRLYKRARIWLDRARNSPLHVHIHEKFCAKDDGIAYLVGFLEPYMQRLCTLYINTECHSLDLFEAILDCWLRHGRPGSAKTLVLRRPPPIPLLASLGPQRLQLLHTKYPQEYIEEFLQPLRALRLHNVCMGWSATAHRGLSELYLESLPDLARPTVSQFADVLRGTPKLRVLKLTKLNFRWEGEAMDVEPVQLECLEVLNVLAMQSPMLKRLLPVIAPGTVPLTMSVALESHNLIFEEVKSFFDRSNVSALYVDARGHNWLPLLFGSLQQLQTLAIREYPLLRTFSHLELNPHNDPLPVCGQLASLSFIGCNLALEPVQNIVAAHSDSLRDVHIWRCKLPLHTGADPPLSLEETLSQLSERAFNFNVSNHMVDYPLTGWSVSDERDVSIPH